MIKKPKKEEYIIAKHDITEEEAAFEPTNIIGFPQQPQNPPIPPLKFEFLNK